MEQFWKQSATEVVEQLYRKQVSPLELIDHMMSRIETTNPSINAVVETNYAHAKRMAIKYKAPKGKKVSVHLYGLPMLIKALAQVQGFKHTSCSSIHRNRQATQSDFHIQQLEKQGGIILDLTNSPEYGSGGNTYNQIYGHTKNPWHIDYNPGGSSGGSAAALALGQTWLADGSDYAGSLRQPAAYCGITSLRPTRGLIPTNFPATIPAVVGPMARNIPDLALLMDAMTTYDPRDYQSVPFQHQGYVSNLSTPMLPKRILWSSDLNFGYIDPEIKKTCENALQWYLDQGAELVDCDLDFSELYEPWLTLRSLDFAKITYNDYINRPDMIKPELLYTIENGLKLNTRQVIEAYAQVHQFNLKLHRYMCDCDALITPTTIIPADLSTRTWIDNINGAQLHDISEWLVFTWSLTLCQMPCMNLPCGFNHQGMPIGLQIASKPFTDHQLINYAHQYEKAHDWHRRLPLQQAYSNDLRSKAA